MPTIITYGDDEVAAERSVRHANAGAKHEETQGKTTGKMCPRWSRRRRTPVVTGSVIGVKIPPHSLMMSTALITLRHLVL